MYVCVHTHAQICRIIIFPRPLPPPRVTVSASLKDPTASGAASSSGLYGVADCPLPGSRIAVSCVWRGSVCPTDVPASVAAPALAPMLVQMPVPTAAPTFAPAHVPSSRPTPAPMQVPTPKPSAKPPEPSCCSSLLTWSCRLQGSPTLANVKRFKWSQAPLEDGPAELKKMSWERTALFNTLGGSNGSVPWV
jgi:hypothetical protein